MGVAIRHNGAEHVGFQANRLVIRSCGIFGRTFPVVRQNPIPTSNGDQGLRLGAEHINTLKTDRDFRIGLE